MRVSITNCNPLMEWDATIGTKTKRFSFAGKAYGPQSTAAFYEALAWIENTRNEL